MPRLDAKEVVSNLHRMKLQEILTNRVPSCEKLALQIVRDMVTIVLPKDLFPYMTRVIPYVKDNITEHRELVYDIFMRLHKRYSANITVDDDAIMQNLLSISVRNLLTGVLDPSHELQDRILKFWTEEKSLNTEKVKSTFLIGDNKNFHLSVSKEILLAVTHYRETLYRERVNRPRVNHKLHRGGCSVTFRACVKLN